jgi:hypothetical protein
MKRFATKRLRYSKKKNQTHASKVAVYGDFEVLSNMAAIIKLKTQAEIKYLNHLLTFAKPLSIA